MLTLHNYISFISGLILMLCAIAIILFPPKYGNILYGIRTKWTMKNYGVWNDGQKLFAVCIFIIGLTFSILGSLKIDDNIPPFAMLALLFIFWSLSKFIVHKILSKKYSTL